MDKTAEQIIARIRKEAGIAETAMRATKDQIARPGEWLVTGFELDDLARWTAKANVFVGAAQYLVDDDPEGSLEMLRRMTLRRVINSSVSGGGDGHGLIRNAENAAQIELLEVILDGSYLY